MTDSDKGWLLGIILLVLAIVSFFGTIVGWVSVWIPILLGISTVWAYSNAYAKSRAEVVKNFKIRCEKEGFTYKPGFSIETPKPKVKKAQEKTFLLGVSEEKNQILIQVTYEHDTMMQDWLINVRDVLSVELSLNNNAVYQAGPVASLAAAAAGGLTFGGAGAIVGSLTTGRVGAGKISELVLNLRMDSIDEPLTQIHFISDPVKYSAAQAELQLAEKWTNLIEVMRYRLANPDKNNA